MGEREESVYGREWGKEERKERERKLELEERG